MAPSITDPLWGENSHHRETVAKFRNGEAIRDFGKSTSAAPFFSAVMDGSDLIGEMGEIYSYLCLVFLDLVPPVVSPIR